jgi:two-component system NtrC family sensor kinase
MPVYALMDNRFVRYAQACAWVALALAVLRFWPLLPVTAGSCLLLAAVMGAAHLGGRGPGLLAAVLAPVAGFLGMPATEPRNLSHGVAAGLFLLLAAAGAAGMTAAHRGAEVERTSLRLREERFRRVLVHLPDVAWTISPEGLVLYISPKVVELTGCTSSEFYAEGTALLLGRIHPDDQPAMQSAMNQLWAEHKPFEMEFRFRHKDGPWVWLYYRAIACHQEGSTTSADGFLQEITLRKRSELELQAKTAFLEAQADSTIDGILVVDESGHCILKNRRFHELFGIEPGQCSSDEDEALLRQVIGLIKRPEAFLSRVRYLYAHRDETSREEIELNNGSILDRYSAPVADAQGRYYGRIWSFRDITERRRSEDSLRQLSAAVEQSPASVMITDPRGRITYVNSTFTRLTGYTAEEVLGKRSNILKSGYSPAEMYRTLWATIQAGKQWRGEFRNRNKQGELYWESAVIAPIRGEDGTISHFLAVKEDITERRALESQLLQAQKMEGIGQLAAGIAHEINTPIQFVTDNLTFLDASWRSASRLLDLYRAAVNAPAAALSQQTAADLEAAEAACDLDFVREEAPRAIEQSLEGTHRVATIVRAMKEFSHPELAEKTHSDLNRGIASTITIACSEWKYVAEIVTDFDADLPPVLCHPGDINQVVLNLLVNAAHAIREKHLESKGRITVRTRLRGEVAEIAVADTGTGIPEAIRHRIFEPFFTTREVGSGTGQGLALTHSIVVRKHHGKIWFETETGKGTTFFVRIPLDAGKQQEAV